MRGTLLGVPIKRIRVFGGLYWVIPFLGNCHTEIIGKLLGSLGGLGWEAPVSGD